MKGLINYLKDVRSELSKVVWPKKEEVIRLTLIVFVFSGLIAIYLGALDLTFTKLLETFLSK